MIKVFFTGAVFIDLRKAFDTVDHNVVVRKLQQIGVVNTELNWFKNYLNNRTQVVKIENKSSQVSDISTGVPQGSILGPLLFVLVINDLPPHLDNCGTLMYADDTDLFYSSKDVKKIEYTLTKDIDKINNWLEENSLFLNKKKTECVLFRTGARLNSVQDFTVYVKGTPITQVLEYKFLGVTLNETLSWNAHVSSILSKAGKRIGMLGRIRSNITINTTNRIYKSFIIPVLEYYDTVWNCCLELLNSDSLEKLQRRTARIVTRDFSSDDVMKCLAYHSLEVRRQEHVYKLVKRCISRKSPQFFHDYFVFNRDKISRVTRQSKLLHLPKVRTESAKKSFYFSGCVIYN